ncbi:MAG: Nif3-like dinuclear metal center hexameric protein [Thermus sp.]|uniref:Nif3-like dinuclear metal center hexameric protein n=1 Tax=Thermus sp. TaxID=275 RepID=UPI00298F381D|nr:Nif3-like dinuclear metal center hexameric protein [Thermus sp.]MDW8016856.1 Nif3-like dinuclear metal center hexameric protein [Thermus sp.]
MERDALVRYLNAYLRLQDFPQDPSLNGLQVEGKGDVTKVGAAVDAGEAIFQKALEEGVDFLLVHHGLFWGRPFPITGHHKRRLELLFRGGINLYAAHLPLDAHPEVGNNHEIARALGLGDLEPYDVGVKGRFPFPTPLVQVADRLGQLTGMQPLVHQGGADVVVEVVIVSGGAAGLVGRVEADLFITGEPKHSVFHETFERGLNVIYAGHYDTEVFGVKALARHLEARFGLPWVFLDHPTGL